MSGWAKTSQELKDFFLVGPLTWILSSELTSLYKESTEKFQGKLTVCGETLYLHDKKCDSLLRSRFGFGGKTHVVSVIIIAFFIETID